MFLNAFGCSQGSVLFYYCIVPLPCPKIFFLDTEPGSTQRQKVRFNNFKEPAIDTSNPTPLSTTRNSGQPNPTTRLLAESVSAKHCPNCWNHSGEVGFILAVPLSSDDDDRDACGAHQTKTHTAFLPLYPHEARSSGPLELAIDAKHTACLPCSFCAVLQCPPRTLHHRHCEDRDADTHKN